MVNEIQGVKINKKYSRIFSLNPTIYDIFLNFELRPLEWVPKIYRVFFPDVFLLSPNFFEVRR